MKKFVKIIVIVVIVLIVAIGALLSYVKFGLPNVGDAPDIKVEITPQRLERGEYLANHVTLCMGCHSSRDWSKFSGPLDVSKVGGNGEKFDRTMGFPGEFYAPNLTPFNLKDWTDGEIFRAITTGVKKDGSAIFPVMPYAAYGKMDKEDIYSIIAYIRTFKPLESPAHERQLDFPVNFIVNTIPTKAQLGKIPSEKDRIAYGGYIVNAGGCIDCHTKAEKGEIIKGMEFGGGRDFPLPSGTVFSANLTPDPETGIGNWTKEQFVARFKVYADSSYKPTNVGPKDFQTVMPWTMLGKMKTSDLEAVYAYLKTLKPIKNQVIKFEPH